MKPKFYAVFCAALLLSAHIKSISQANTTLSNLASPIAVNQDLLPNTDNTRNLGSLSKSWETIFLDNNIYLKDSLFINSNGTQNTFTGQRAGSSLTSGSNNAGFGFHALYNNAANSFNSAFGSYALASNTASSNSAFGYRALNLNTTGTTNAAVGAFALYRNTSGNSNVALGYQALSFNTTGQYNEATGYSSLYHNTTGNFNAATGFEVLYNNTTGNNNVADGAKALFSNTTGYSDIALGIKALYLNKTGNNNIAVGDSALYNNTAGNNVAVGSKALYANTTGFNNTALGYNATINNTPNSNAAAIGSNAYADCSNCLILGSVNGINGAAADVSVGIGISNPNANNSLQVQSNIGTGIFAVSKVAGSNAIFAQCSNGSNADFGVWGLAATGYAGYFSGNVEYTGTLNGPSDAKLKENIKPSGNMLDKLMQLKPSRYNFKAEYNKMNLPKGQQIGFIAQDMEKVFPQLVTNAYDKLVDSGKVFEFKSVNYIGLIPILTKAIQELAMQNDSLKQQYTDKFEAQQKEINELKAMIVALVNNHQSTVISNASLAQNVPNPFSNSTSISYTLPQQYSSAKIIITDKKGVALKQISLNTKGRGNVNVDASTFAAGAYQYSLYVNGKLIDTKQMLSSR